MDLDEAYAPLFMMRRALVMPLALVVLATVLAFIVSAKAQHLRVSLAKSERRAQQTVVELSAVNKELEAFSYSVSHDLRAPLRHIMGFVDLLKRRLDGQLDETSAAHLAVIGDAATRMNALIDDLLAFSQTSRTDMHQTAVDLDELAREAIADVGRRSAGTEHRMARRTASGRARRSIDAADRARQSAVERGEIHSAARPRGHRSRRAAAFRSASG